MEVSKAKSMVINAGLKLVQSGLIARTWGNVSCRISDNQFVITPSGLNYETLTEDDIVVVNIADLSYDGDIKPSSEKGIHAEVYKKRSDIHFVIHTHQMNASAVSTLDMNLPIEDKNITELIGEKVLCASYGLPSTKKLRKGIIHALEKSNSKAIIMSHHGLLCMGEDDNEAFEIAYQLERLCDQFIFNKYMMDSEKVNYSEIEMLKYFLAKLNKKDNSIIDENESFEITSSKRIKDDFTFWIDEKPITVNIKTGKVLDINIKSIPSESEIHRAIYAERKDVNYIKSCSKLDIKALSSGEVILKPYLDDLAQIIGTSVKFATLDKQNIYKTSSQVIKVLKGRNAVFIKNKGALCCGSNEGDADAVALVLEKGIKAFIATKIFNTGKPINHLECLLMRFIYQKKYSRIANNK